MQISLTVRSSVENLKELRVDLVARIIGHIQPRLKQLIWLSLHHRCEVQFAKLVTRLKVASQQSIRHRPENSLVEKCRAMRSILSLPGEISLDYTGLYST